MRGGMGELMLKSREYPTLFSLFRRSRGKPQGDCETRVVNHDSVQIILHIQSKASHGMLASALPDCFLA